MAPYSDLPIAAHSDLSHSVLPVASHSGLMRPSASSITDVLYVAYSDILHSILLTNPNPYSILHSGSITPFINLPITAHSNLYSILPVISQKGLSNPYSVLLVTAHSNLSHSALPVATYSGLSPYRGLSIGGLALSAKYLSGNWILDSGATSHICSDIDFFNRVAPTSASIIWGNVMTLLARGKGTIIVKLPNSASAILDLVLYMLELGLNILSIPRLLQKGARIDFTYNRTRIFLESGTEL